MLDDEPDSTDADLIEATVATHGWELLLRRLCETRNQHLAALRRPCEAAETSYERGFLDALDVVISLPRILIDETRRSDHDERR